MSQPCGAGPTPLSSMGLGAFDGVSSQPPTDPNPCQLTSQPTRTPPQVRRLEYLASTGESPGISLRDVIKPSNRLFRSVGSCDHTWGSGKGT